MESSNNLLAIFQKIVQTVRGYLDNKFALFAFFFLLTFILYCPTVGAGFTYDFIGIAHRYDGIPFSGVSKYFSQNGFLPVYHLVMCAMYKTFRLHGLPWYILATSLHAFTAFLLFQFIRTLLDAIDNRNAFTIAFCSALIFMLYPLHTETVVWVPAIHYLICACLMLGILLAVMHYAKNQNPWLVLLIPVLQLVANFTLEESLVIPVMVLFFILLGPAALFKKAKRSKLLMMVTLPQVAAVIIYFGVHAWVMGGLYSHNKGADSDPFNFNLAAMSSNYIKFLLKFLFFLPYFAFDKYIKVLEFVSRPLFAWIALFIMSSIFVFSIYRYRTFSQTGKVAFLLFLLFSVALAPVINFPHQHIFPAQNARYGYFASMFLFPMLVILVFQFLPRFKYVPIAAFLMLSIIFLSRSIGFWHNEGKVREGLITDFRWYDKEHIYILALPESFRGAWMFQAPADSNMFAQFVEVYTGKNIKPKTKEVVQFVMSNEHDSVYVQVMADSVLHIQSVCDGSWLVNMKGKFPNENFDFKTVGDGNYCDFIRKVKQPNSVYIYSVGDKWKEVAF